MKQPPPTGSQAPAAIADAHAAGGIESAEAADAADPGAFSLKSRTVRSSLWTTLGYGTSQMLRMASMVVLTRLLTRDDYGLMDLVTPFVVGLQMFSDVGIGPSIIQNRRGDEDRFYNTAWTIQVVRGILLWMCACALSWPLATFYDRPEFLWMLPAVSLTALISGFNSTALYTLNRHVQFGRLTVLELATQCISISVMVTWAWLSPSVWALIAGSLSGSLFTLAASHFISGRIRNRFQWDRDAAGALIHFGKWIFISTALTFFATQSDRLIFGKAISLGLLGVYGRALMLATMPAAAILKVGGSVAFAAYSRVSHDPDRFRSAFSRLRLPLVAAGGLITTGLIGCGPALVRLLLDPDFEAAGWMLQVLAIGAWFLMLESTSGAALLAAGKANWVALGNATKLISLIAFMSAGAWLDIRRGGSGFAGAVWGVALADIPRYLVVALGARRLGLRLLAADFGMTLLVAASAALAWVCGLSAAAIASQPHWANALAVVASALIACLIWCPILYRIWRWANRTHQTH